MPSTSHATIRNAPPGWYVAYQERTADGQIIEPRHDGPFVSITHAERHRAATGGTRVYEWRPVYDWRTHR